MVPFLAVIITDDGGNSDQHQLVLEARRARSKGIKLLVIGVGDRVNADLLASVASSDRLFVVNSYESLSLMGVRVAVLLCQGQLALSSLYYRRV